MRADEQTGDCGEVREEVRDRPARHGVRRVRGVRVREHAARRADVQAQGRVDVDDLAKAAALDQAEHALHGSAELVRVVLEQPASGSGGSGAELEPLRVARRDRLLDQDVRASGETLERQSHVRADRRRDVHDVGTPLGDERREVGVVSREPEALGGELRGRRRAIARGHLEPRDAGERPKVLLRDATRSDYGDFHVAFRTSLLYSISVDVRRLNRVSRRLKCPSHVAPRPIRTKTA